jgi:hypothetical protein
MEKTPINTEFEFEETQKITNVFLWVLMFGTFTLLLSILIYQVFSGETIGNKPANNVLLFGIILIYCLPGILMMFYARLKVRINKDSILYGWNIPTKELNKINWSDVQSCELIQHKFVGYHYKLTKKYGTVYNTKGNTGLHITKKSGEKILLGTLKTNELAAALTKIGVDIKNTI